jgi:hypothetical protein
VYCGKEWRILWINPTNSAIDPGHRDSRIHGILDPLVLDAIYIEHDDHGIR